MIERFKAWVGRFDEDRRVRGRLSWGSVVFHCSETDAANMDLAVGPCAWRVGPRGGRVRPLAPPSSQLYSTPLSQIAALFALLAEHSADAAFEDYRSAGRGCLVRVSKLFAAELAALGDGPGEQAQQRMAAQAQLAERWFQTTPWHRGMQIGGVESHVWLMVYAAVQASRKNLSVFAWEGPAIDEYRLSMGQT